MVLRLAVGELRRWRRGRYPLAVLLAASCLSHPAMAQDASGAGGTQAQPQGAASPDAPGAIQQPTIQPSFQTPQYQQPISPQQAVQPSIQTPSTGAPEDPGAASGNPHATEPVVQRPTSTLDPGMAPAQVYQPGPQSDVSQALTSAPVSPNAAAEGLVQANPSLIFGDDMEWATGLAMAAISGLQYSVEGRMEYHDNIARRPSGQPLPPSYKSRSDWRFSPTVNVSAGKPFGQQLLFLNASLGYDFHAHNTRLNRQRIMTGGGLQWALGTRCGGRLQGNYSSRQTRISDFDEFIPSTRSTLSATASASCRLVGKLSASGGYTWRKLNNSLEERKRSDVQGGGYNVGLNYPIGTKGTLSGSWFSQNNRYPNQLLEDGAENEIRIKGYSVGAGYRINRMFAVNGSIGRTKVRSANPYFADFSGLNWSLGLNYTGPKFGAMLGTGKATSAMGNAGNVSNSKHWTASVNYALNSRIGLQAGYNHNNIDRFGIAEGPGGIPELMARNRVLDTFNLTASYQMNRLLSGNLTYRRQHRPQSDTIYGFTDNSIGLTVRASF